MLKPCGGSVIENKTLGHPAENRIISVDGGSTATYVYDAEGRRIEKTTGGVTTNFTYDLSGNVVAERSSSCSYCWTTGYNYFDGALSSIYTNNTTYFVHADHLGSTRLITGYPTPNTVQCNDYYPFGELNASGCSQSANITHLFTGKERDSESNLDNFLARYYSSAMARFMSPDPYNFAGFMNSDDPQGWNGYSYVAIILCDSSTLRGWAIANGR